MLFGPSDNKVGTETSTLETVMGQVHEWIDGTIRDVQTFFVENGPKIIESITSFATGFLNAIKVLWTGVGSGEGGAAASNLESAMIAVHNIIEKIIDAFALLSFGEQNGKFGGKLPSGVKDTLLQIREWLSGILTAIRSLFGGGSGDSASEIEGEIEEKKASLTGIFDALTGGNGLLASVINIDNLGGSSGSLKSKLMLGGAALGIGKLFSGVQSILDSLAWIRGGEDRALSAKTPVLMQIARVFESLAWALGSILASVVVFALMKPEQLEQGAKMIEYEFSLIENLITTLAAFSFGQSVLGSVEERVLGAEGSSNGLSGVGKALEGLGKAFLYISGSVWLFSKIEDPDKFKKGLERVNDVVGILKSLLLDVGLVAAIIDIGSAFNVAAGSGGFLGSAKGLVKTGATAAVAIGIAGAIEGLFAAIKAIYDAIAGAENKGLLDVLEDGGDVLAKVSSGIGKFIGGFASGFKEAQADGITDFGTALSSLVTAISGVDFGDEATQLNIDNATATFTKINDFLTTTATSELDQSTFDKVNEIKGIIESNNENVKGFGEAVGALISGVQGISTITTLESDVETAKTNVTTVADFLVELAKYNGKIEKDKGALIEWFKGGTTQSQVLEDLGLLGEKIGGAIPNISGISTDESTFKDDLTVALDSIKQVADLLILLGSGEYEIPDPTSDVGPTAQNFQATLSYLSQMAGELKGFSNLTGGEDYSSLADFTTVIANLKTILSGQGDNAITSENFLKGLDANAVITKLNEFTTSVSQSAEANKETLTQATGSFNDAGGQMASSLASGIGDSTDVSGAAETMVGSAITAVNNMVGSFKTTGGNIAKGLANGITYNAYLAISAAKHAAQAMKDAIDKTFGVSSPAKEMIKTGKYIDMGLSIGIDKYSRVAEKSATVLAKSSLDTFQSSFGSLTSLLTDNVDDNPVITPVVDTSNIGAASSYMDRVFGSRTFGVESANIASGVFSRRTGSTSNQNGSSGKSSNGNTMNNAVNFTNNNFTVRSDQDIYSLANELAALTRQQQRSLGSA